jgi:hypothetical protein
MNPDELEREIQKMLREQDLTDSRRREAVLAIRKMLSVPNARKLAGLERRGRRPDKRYDPMRRNFTPTEIDNIFRWYNDELSDSEFRDAVFFELGEPDSRTLEHYVQLAGVVAQSIDLGSERVPEWMTTLEDLIFWSLDRDFGELPLDTEVKQEK